MTKSPCLLGKSCLDHDSTGLADSLQAGGHWFEPSTAHRGIAWKSDQILRFPSIVRAWLPPGQRSRATIHSNLSVHSSAGRRRLPPSRECKAAADRVRKRRLTRCRLARRSRGAAFRRESRAPFRPAAAPGLRVLLGRGGARPVFVGCIVVLRLASWIRPAGGSPVRVSAGAPGSRPRSEGEIPRAERGVESLFGGSKRVGWDCSLVKSTIGEPSRSCHGEGHVRQSWFRIGCGGSLRGTETCTRAGSDHGTRETRLPSLVSRDRSYKPMAKSSGGQRESEGVVLVMIGVKLKALGAKGPCFGHAGCEGKR